MSIRKGVKTQKEYKEKKFLQLFFLINMLLIGAFIILKLIDFTISMKFIDNYNIIESNKIAEPLLSNPFLLFGSFFVFDLILLLINYLFYHFKRIDFLKINLFFIILMNIWAFWVIYHNYEILQEVNLN